MSCRHLVSRKCGERDGGKHEKLPPCWKIVGVLRVRVVEMPRVHDGDVGWESCFEKGGPVARSCAGNGKVRREEVQRLMADGRWGAGKNSDSVRGKCGVYVWSGLT